MSETPYTDTDLRAEAARSLGDGMDGLEILVAMADRTPWSALDTDDFNTAHGQVLRMVEAAADVSEWAVNLGADGLEPVGANLNIQDTAGDDRVRLHFAFAPDMDKATRQALMERVADVIRTA
jgi:hypothetical protein